jgi:hypothetical protein
MKTGDLTTTKAILAFDTKPIGWGRSRGDKRHDAGALTGITASYRIGSPHLLG